MRRIRISLRLLLALLSILAIGIGILTNTARWQQFACQRIMELGGVYQFEYAFEPGQSPSMMRALLAKALGDHVIYTVRGVGWRPGPTASGKDYEAMIDAMDDLDSLQSVAFWPRQWMDATKAKTTGYLTAQGGINDEAVSYLLANLRKIEHLSLTSARLSNAAVQSLVDDRRLRTIQVSRVTAYGGDRPIDYFLDLEKNPVHWSERDTIPIPSWRPHRKTDSPEAMHTAP